MSGAVESSWKKLRDLALKEGTKPSKTVIIPLKPSNLFYRFVWGHVSEDEDSNFDPIGNEVHWMNLDIKHTGDTSADGHRTQVNVDGEVLWNRWTGKFTKLERDHGETENIWEIKDITWSNHSGGEEPGPAVEGNGFAILDILDDAGHPFVELIYIDKRGDCVRALGKLQKEKDGTDSPLTAKDAKRLQKAGIADLPDLVAQASDSDSEGEKETAGAQKTYHAPADGTQKDASNTKPRGVKRKTDGSVDGEGEPNAKNIKIGSTLTSPEAAKASWKKMRDGAVKSGTITSKTPVSLPSLSGYYRWVWDDETCMQNTCDIEDEECWLKLAVTNVGGTNGSEVDVVGSVLWYRFIGNFTRLERAEDETENIWRMADVVWSNREDYEPEEGPLPVVDGHGLAVLDTLDDKGRPFIELLFNNRDDRVVRAVGKIQDEDRPYDEPLSETECMRLEKDGVAPDMEY